jgi:hypothetical protein
MSLNLLNDINVDAVVRNMDIGQLECICEYRRFRPGALQRSRGLEGVSVAIAQVEYLIHLKRPLPMQPDSAGSKRTLGEWLETLLYDSELK